MLSLYRSMLAFRRTETAFHGDDLEWIDALGPQAIAFRRGLDFACVVNLGPEPVALPGDWHPFLASGPLVDRQLPADTAVWLRT